jgi:phosphoserine phosphatase RsbU/P
MDEVWERKNLELSARQAECALLMLEDREAGKAGAGERNSKRVRALEQELADMRSEQASIYRSFFEAAQIQRRLCAPRQLDLGDFAVAGEIFPVRHLSGDFFKVFELGPALGVVIGDIAGKGLSAGIWMPHLVSLLHSCALEHADPAEAIAAANRALCSGCGEPPLAAVFFARVDLRSGSMVYCNAGLPSPLVLKRDGSVEHLDQGGPMLGALRQASYASAAARLGPGETLVACTDGVTECQNRQAEEFELARLSEAARVAGQSSASHTLFSTLGAVLDFADGSALRDDLTLLVVRREAGAAPDGELAPGLPTVWPEELAARQSRGFGGN